MTQNDELRRYDELRKAALSVVMSQRLSSYHWPPNAVKWVGELEKVLRAHGHMPNGFREFMQTDVGKEFFPNLRGESHD